LLAQLAFNDHGNGNVRREIFVRLLMVRGQSRTLNPLREFLDPIRSLRFDLGVKNKNF
jgi:hypothetical protein